MGNITKNVKLTDLENQSGLNFAALSKLHNKLELDPNDTRLNSSYGLDLTTLGIIENGKEACDVVVNRALELGYSTFNGGTYTVMDNATIHKLAKTTGNSYLRFKGVKYPFGDINNNITLNVPSVFYNIQQAMQWLKNKRIANGVDVTIKVADGTYNYGWTTNLNHIDGEHIFIRGNEEDRSKVKINFEDSNDKDCFSISNGHTLGWLNGFTIIGVVGWIAKGDWKPNCNGSAIRAFDGGTIKCGVAIHSDKMYYGLRAMHGGVITAVGVPSAVNVKGGGVKVTNAGDVGIHAHTATIYCNCAEAYDCGDNAHGLGFGIAAEAGGYVVSEYAIANNNIKAGFYALSNGTVWAHGVYASGNDYGVRAWGGTVECNTLKDDITVLENNVSGGIQSIYGGLVGANKAICQTNGNGVIAEHGGIVDSTGVKSIKNTGAGYIARTSATITGFDTFAEDNGADGYFAETNGTIHCPNANANRNKGTGYLAQNFGKIFAKGFGGVGNGAFCSPAQSSVNPNGGNVNSYVID